MTRLSSCDERSSRMPFESAMDDIDCDMKD